MNQIKADFGSINGLKRCIKECGLSAFGSAWIWLAQDDLGHLRVTNTHNAENPLRTGMTPLLTCDVWEHAYYIDYRNERGKYMDAFLELMNLDFASQCFTRQMSGNQNQISRSFPQKKTTIENRRTFYVG
jgi:Fe-Mn family superoxide dismutase